MKGISYLDDVMMSKDLLRPWKCLIFTDNAEPDERQQCPSNFLKWMFYRILTPGKMILQGNKVLINSKHIKCLQMSHLYLI